MSCFSSLCRHAHSEPGIATPHIITKTIDHTHKYLILMTDGVYKSIESMFMEQEAIESNKVLVNMMERSLGLVHGNFNRVSDSLLERICHIHKEAYMKSAQSDPRSPLAVGCRKRDDMTLIVYKFPDVPKAQ